MTAFSRSPTAQAQGKVSLESATEDHQPSPGYGFRPFAFISATSKHARNPIFFLELASEIFDSPGFVRKARPPWHDYTGKYFSFSTEALQDDPKVLDQSQGMKIRRNA